MHFFRKILLVSGRGSDFHPSPQGGQNISGDHGNAPRKKSNSSVWQMATGKEGKIRHSASLGICCCILQIEEAHLSRRSRFVVLKDWYLIHILLSEIPCPLFLYSSSSSSSICSWACTLFFSLKRGPGRKTDLRYRPLPVSWQDAGSRCS